MPDRTIVPIGCTVDADYSFLLPLTCLLWRRIGFEPLAMLVGNDRHPTNKAKHGGGLEFHLDSRARYVFSALAHHRIATYSLAAVDGYRPKTTAQNCRAHAAAIETLSNFDNDLEIQFKVEPGDWFMPSDADLWPIKKEFYQRHENTFSDAVVYYWNGDHFLGKSAFLKSVKEGKRGQTLPMCHVAMRASKWRELFSLKPGENVADAVERTLNDWFSRYPRNDTNLWMSDQDTLTERLCRQWWFPNGTPPHDQPGVFMLGNFSLKFVNRKGHPPVDRLDRSDPSVWTTSFNPSKWVDAHLPKNPWSVEIWPALLSIIDALIPEHSAWARKYHADYTRA